MPRDWSNWARVMFSTRGAWLPGDERGFRDHGRRIESSGDYRNPPPEGEHVGLRKYSEALSDGVVVLPRELRDVIAEALGRKLIEQRHPSRTCSVAATHVHVLLRAGSINARVPIGRAKQFASHQVREVLPGRIWGQRSHIVRIKDETHYRAVVGSIERHGDHGARVWVYPELRRGSAQASKS
jgi:hypothetical protein